MATLQDSVERALKRTPPHYQIDARRKTRCLGGEHSNAATTIEGQEV